MTRFEVSCFQPFVGQHCETVATGLAGLTGDAAPLHAAAQRRRRIADIEVGAMRLLAGI